MTGPPLSDWWSAIAPIPLSFTNFALFRPAICQSGNTNALESIDFTMTSHPRTRSACDRCHFQKLKCAKQVGDPSCTRCLRAGARCVYSPPGGRINNMAMNDHDMISGADADSLGFGTLVDLEFDDSCGYTGGLDWVMTDRSGADFDAILSLPQNTTSNMPQSNQSPVAEENEASTARCDSNVEGGNSRRGPPFVTKPSCFDELARLLQDTDEVLASLPLEDLLHCPAQKSPASSLKTFSEKFEAKVLLENVFIVSQRLIDVYPTAVTTGLAVAKASPPRPICDHHRENSEAILALMALEQQVLSNGSSLGPNVPLANLLISCHLRLLDILDRLVLLVAACTRTTLANRREPDFCISEMRVGSFVPHKTAAVQMHFALLQHLLSRLSDELGLFHKALSSMQTPASVANRKAILLLQCEDVAEKHTSKEMQIKSIEKFLREFKCT